MNITAATEARALFFSSFFSSNLVGSPAGDSGLAISWNKVHAKIYASNVHEFFYWNILAFPQVWLTWVLHSEIVL